jgi:catechol-2,3-dioxygenase
MPSSTSNEKRTVVRGLEEIAVRVNDLDAMQEFYEEIIGLPLMARDPTCAFFKIAEGHTQSARLVRPLRTNHFHGARCRGHEHDRCRGCS